MIFTEKQIDEARKEIEAGRGASKDLKAAKAILGTLREKAVTKVFSCDPAHVEHRDHAICTVQAIDQVFADIQQIVDLGEAAAELIKNLPEQD